MRTIVILITLAFSSFAFSAELPVTESLEQRLGSQLQTYIGGVIFKIKRTSALPNAFGNADVFGRKVDRGFVELRYLGQTSDGKVKLKITDVETMSNETTMNRTPIHIVSGNTQAYYNPLTNTVSASSTAFGVSPEKAKNEALPPNNTDFEIELSKNEKVRFGSVAVEFIDMQKTSLTYRLSR